MLSWIESINSILWGPIMLVLLLGTGLYYTIATRFVQVRRFRQAINQVFGSAFKKGHTAEEGSLSIFPGLNYFHRGSSGYG
jgi:AGCS family alanine or glycine:cation symporter